MSIVALKKCTLIGLVREKLDILEELQVLGCVHLEPLRATEEAGQCTQPTRYLRALRFLASCPRKLRPVHEDPDFDPQSLTERCLALEERMRTLQDRCDFLRARVRDLGPWGEFHLPPEGALSGLRLWFYLAPARQLKSLPKGELAWQVVHQTPQLAYIVVLAPEEPSPAQWPLSRVHAGRLSLSHLQAELGRLEVELEDCMLERERLTRFLALFYRHLGELEDLALRRQAASTALEVEELFVLRGWVPVVKVKALEEFACTRQLGLLLEDPTESETPPTLLSNPQPFAAGEMLVRFYQTPHYYDWDPSAVVFCSFVLFFAIMLADAGYALLLLVGLGLLRRRLSPDFKTLGVWAAGVSLVWGMLTGGYFGYLLSVLAPLRLLAVGDFAAMLPFSVALGLAHLSVANLIRAWQGYRRGQPWLAPLGWVAVAWGGFGLWQTEGYVWLSVLIGGGLAIVLIDSSRQPIKGWIGVGWRVLKGLGELTKVTRLFGDVLSYLRLVAIALVGSSLAVACNALAAEVRGVVGLGILESLLVLLLGHGINFVLSVMGAVIHGLRLNCIEFFGWALVGEGRPFQAFAKHGDAKWKT